RTDVPGRPSRGTALSKAGPGSYHIQIFPYFLAVGTRGVYTRPVDRPTCSARSRALSRTSEAGRAEPHAPTACPTLRPPGAGDRGRAHTSASARGPSAARSGVTPDAMPGAHVGEGVAKAFRRSLVRLSWGRGTARRSAEPAWAGRRTPRGGQYFRQVTDMRPGEQLGSSGGRELPRSTSRHPRRVAGA